MILPNIIVDQQLSVHWRKILLDARWEAEFGAVRGLVIWFQGVNKR